MWLFLDSTLSNLNFEASFVGIRDVLIEIWMLEHEFQNRNFSQFRIFLRVMKSANKLLIKYLSFVYIVN